MNRRAFLGLGGAAALGMVLDPDLALWVPGRKTYFDMGAVEPLLPGYRIFAGTVLGKTVRPDVMEITFDLLSGRDGVALEYARRFKASLDVSGRTAMRLAAVEPGARIEIRMVDGESMVAAGGRLVSMTDVRGATVSPDPPVRKLHDPSIETRWANEPNAMRAFGQRNWCRWPKPPAHW